MRRCKICKQEKLEAEFDAHGTKLKSFCRECGVQRKALGSSLASPEDLTGDLGRVFAAIKKQGEHEGAKKVAAELIEFLKRKYVEGA